MFSLLQQVPVWWPDSRGHGGTHLPAPEEQPNGDNCDTAQALSSAKR